MVEPFLKIIRNMMPFFSQPNKSSINFVQLWYEIFKKVILRLFTKLSQIKNSPNRIWFWFAFFYYDLKYGVKNQNLKAWLSVEEYKAFIFKAVEIFHFNF